MYRARVIIALLHQKKDVLLHLFLFPDDIAAASVIPASHNAQEWQARALCSVFTSTYDGRHYASKRRTDESPQSKLVREAF